jgi:hypothetical protein
VSARLTVTETIARGKVIGLSARVKKKKLTVLASASATISAGHGAVLRLSLRRGPRLLLARHHQRKAKLNVVQVLAGKSRLIATTTITLKPTGQRTRPR